MSSKARKVRPDRPHGAQDAPGRGRPSWLAWGIGVALLVSAGGVLWLLSGPRLPAAPVRSANQNVLLITIDTLRADALGSMGGRAATPNLDRLASLGVRYESAHAHAVITLPSHASILTGRYPFEHGIHDNAGFRLPAGTPTLAGLLRDAGMATGAFVGAFAVDSRFGLNAGFDVYDERYGKSDTTSGFKMAERRADAVVRVATDWIGRQQGRWFAWVHVFDPHAPYEPPAPFDRQYADQPYLGEVAFTDAALGPLLDAARDPSGRPTLVVVTGDHGEALGDHGEMTHGLFAYESTLRIPLIVAQVTPDAPMWNTPDPVKREGLLSAVAARHVDIVPSILDALGLPKPADLPGSSLMAGADGDSAERASYFEAMSATFNRGWAPLTGVLLNRQKYIDLPLPELYDLPSDAGETRNLAEREAERRRVLDARLRSMTSGAPESRREEDPEARARLQALGYVSGSAPVKAHYTEADDPKRLLALDQMMHEAVDLYERKRPREAIAVYQRLIAMRPEMEVPYAQLSMLQWELGRPAEAIATLRAAMRAGAASVAVQTKLGTYLAETGQVDEAIPLLREATRGEAPELDALNALGIALGRAGRPGDARAVFERILRLNSSNTIALENLGAIAVAEGRLADARRSYALALEGDPSSSQAHNGLGVVEFKSGNRKAAIEHWKQAVARDPANFDALYNVAMELVNDGRPAEAAPYLEQFERTAPRAFYARDLARVSDTRRRIGAR